MAERLSEGRVPPGSVQEDLDRESRIRVIFTTTKAERFDEVDEELNYAYHGWNYVVVGADAEFTVRTYDDEPGAFTVIAPDTARISPAASDLVMYLLSAMQGHSVLFFDPQRGGYRRVDLTTLAFVVD